MKIQTNLKHLAAFNFVSLTDIVMLLLIFFLLASSFLLQPGIKVKLPKARAVETDAQKQIVVTITKAGSIYFNYQPIAWDELSPRIYQALLEMPNSLVVIVADEEVPLSLAVNVLDIAKGAGGERFFIATEPKAE